MFLYHKNKNTFWDIDNLTHWTQVRVLPRIICGDHVSVEIHFRT